MKIGAIVWGVKNLKRSIEFWTQALDYELAFEPAQDFAILQSKDGRGVRLSLNVVSSEKARRHHLDIYSNNFDADVEGLLQLGASKRNWDYLPGEDYIVLADPDGNPFCVIPIEQE